MRASVTSEDRHQKADVLVRAELQLSGPDHQLARRHAVSDQIHFIGLNFGDARTTALSSERSWRTSHSPAPSSKIDRPPSWPGRRRMYGRTNALAPITSDPHPAARSGASDEASIARARLLPRRERAGDVGHGGLSKEVGDRALRVIPDAAAVRSRPPTWASHSTASRTYHGSPWPPSVLLRRDRVEIDRQRKFIEPLGSDKPAARRSAVERKVAGRLEFPLLARCETPCPEASGARRCVGLGSSKAELPRRAPRSRPSLGRPVRQAARPSNGGAGYFPSNFLSLFLLPLSVIGSATFGDQVVAVSGSEPVADLSSDYSAARSPRCDPESRRILRYE